MSTKWEPSIKIHSWWLFLVIIHVFFVGQFGKLSSLWARLTIFKATKLHRWWLFFVFVHVFIVVRRAVGKRLSGWSSGWSWFWQHIGCTRRAWSWLGWWLDGWREGTGASVLRPEQRQNHLWILHLMLSVMHCRHLNKSLPVSNGITPASSWAWSFRESTIRGSTNKYFFAVW